MIGERLDKYIAAKHSELSRSQIQKMIKSEGILVNGKKSKAAYVLKEGDDVDVGSLTPQTFEAEEFNFDIIYEDDSCLVLDKPAGIVVHPGDDSHMTGTVANALINIVDEGVGNARRPGIVHRLDKDTSGLMVIAKTQDAYDSLVSQFKKKKVHKVYVTLVRGIMEYDEGVVNSPIGRDLKDRKKMAVVASSSGKEAVSRFKVLHEYEHYSFVEVEIETGRTHQIRVHMSAIGHPVIGDSVYGNKNTNKKFEEKYFLKRQFLHAKSLTFESPQKKEQITCSSKLPKVLDSVLSRLV